ncbi:MAG: hypothetical protein ACJAZO_003603 [Myxococcota bacterium]|jgi:hypothetical protein
MRSILFSAPEDGLASPYQVGARFDIQGVGRNNLVTQLTLVSSDPDIFSVVERRTETDANTQQRYAVVQTNGAGTADLEVRQGNRIRHSATIEVMTPDRIVLAPIQRLIVTLEDETLEEEPTVDCMDVLVGNEAEFERHPMAGDLQLSGAVLPDFTLPNGQAEAGRHRTDDEFDVVLIAAGEGVTPLTLTYPGQTFTADVEGHTQVGAVDLRCVEDQALAHNFGGFGCIATAETITGQPLFGVFPQWSQVDEDGTATPLDADALLPADILTYQIAEGSNETGPEIRIAVGELTDSEPTFGPLSGVDFDNSNTVTACSSLSPWSLWLAGPALPLLGLCRRRTGGPDMRGHVQPSRPDARPPLRLRPVWLHTRRPSSHADSPNPTYVAAHPAVRCG